MSETTLLAEQSLHTRTMCPDCESSITECVECHQHVCTKHQKRVQGYLVRGLVTMCGTCAEDFADYKIFVNPRYPAA